MGSLGHLLALTAPLFLLVLVGYALMRWAKWDPAIADALTQFVFAVAVPALLFRLMSGFSRLPPVDPRLLLAYFGGSLVVFAAARVFAHRIFGMDGAAQSVFGLGGIFSNNLLLGLPLAKTLLGDASLPVVSLILVFNSFLLWMLVTVSVEWARNRSASLPGLLRTAKGVLANPIVASIVAGTAYGFLAVPLPAVIDATLELDRPGGGAAVADRPGHGSRALRVAPGHAAKRRSLRVQAVRASAGRRAAGAGRSRCRRWKPWRSCCSRHCPWAPTST